jgi:hypothetical protein
LRRWIRRTILLVAAVALLLLGAAANGFEPSLRRVPPSVAAGQTSTETVLLTPGGPALRVSHAKLLIDPRDNSTAVIVRVTNPNARRPVADAPIAIDLLDRAGAVVGTSADAGTDPLLLHVPYIAPGASVLFVSDTIAASAKPATAHVRATAIFSAGRRVRLAVRALQLRTDAFGFSSAAGTIVSSAAPEKRNVLIQAVVRRGGQIVAAGTTVAPVPPRGRSRRFEIVLIGDAKGGVLRVWAPPQ